MLRSLFKKAAVFAGILLFGASLTMPVMALNVDQNRNVSERNCSATQNVCYVRVTINYNDPRISTGQWFATLPKNAYILQIDSDVTTAFNATTTNVLTIGATKASSNEIIADGGSSTANISNSTTTIATGILHLTTALGLGLAITGNTTYQTAANGAVPIYAKYTQTGTAATTGAVTIIITFIKNDDL